MGLNLFDTIEKIPESQQHKKFRMLKDNDEFKYIRKVILCWVEEMIDKDNNIIEKFQKDFHSSFWEFYLFGCFHNMGFKIDQTHNRPDFMIKAPFEINIEAVVANIKQGGRKEGSRNIEDIMEMFVPPRNQKDYHELQHEAIVRQSNAIMSKINKYKEYSKCQWFKNDVPFMIALGSYGQVNYGREYVYPMIALLYGLYFNPTNGVYNRIYEIQKPNTSSKIPVGIFTSDKYSNISAILYSCTATLGKATSISISQGDISDNVVYTIRRDLGDEEIPYKLQEVSKDNPEFLTEGLFVFHNPYAKNEIDIKIFENKDIIQFFLEDGKLSCTTDAYPIVCRLNIPKALKLDFRNLIDEYVRQYNCISPIEYYNIDNKDVDNIDFSKNCLVLIWMPTTRQGLFLKNVFYQKSQKLSDNFLKHDALEFAKKMRKNTSYYLGEVVKIDIIRSKEQLEYMNRP